MDDIEIVVRLSPDKEKVMEVLQKAAQMLVENVRAAIPASGIRVRSGRILDAVMYKTINDSEVNVYVDEKKAPYFNYLEQGYGQFSMRKGLLYGRSSKISKEGFRYARIPIDDKVVTISEKKANGWVHPGYEGKYPFFIGVENSRYKIIQLVKDFFDLSPDDINSEKNSSEEAEELTW